MHVKTEYIPNRDSPSMRAKFAKEDTKTRAVKNPDKAAKNKETRLCYGEEGAEFEWNGNIDRETRRCRREDAPGRGVRWIIFSVNIL